MADGRSRGTCLYSFQPFDGVIRDKDELANKQEQRLQELEQALQDAERRAQQSTPVFVGASCKVKQIWELWPVNVALAMSTWNDVAVTYWHQVYIQSEESHQDWRRSGLADRFAYEKRYLYGRKAPVPAIVIQWKRYYDMNC